MTKEERIAAIQTFGYTDREAAFLCLAALHGGYFLRRQYNTFLQQRPGGNADRLIEKAVMQGHVRIHESADRTFIYHIGAKSFFEVIGEEDNRNRRWRRPYSVKVKLMGLDFVLAHPEHRYLATETEKLEFFVGTLGLKHECLPLRIYRSRDGRNQTTRYFVDKFPVFLSGASSAPSPVVTFCYVNGNLGKPDGLDTHLLQYRELFGRLESLQLVYVSTHQGTFAKAERIFRRLCGKRAAESARALADPDVARLLGHFRARVLLERRETAGFDKQQLDRLRDELQEFRGPEHEHLYQLWREQGDGTVLVGTQGVSTASGTFATYRLDHDYGFFGPLARGVPA